MDSLVLQPKPTLAIDLTTQLRPRVSYYDYQQSKIIEIPIPRITKESFINASQENRHTVIKELSRTRTLPGKTARKVAFLESNPQIHPFPSLKKKEQLHQRTVKRYFSQAIHERKPNNSGTHFKEPLEFLYDYLQILSHTKQHVTFYFNGINLTSHSSHIVIAIPTSLSIIQRQSLNSAAKVMGWKLIRLVNNTTALAFHRWFGYMEKKTAEETLKSSIKLSCCLTQERLDVSIVGIRNSKISVFASYTTQGFEDDLTLRSKVYRELKRCQDFLLENQFLLSEVLMINNVEVFEDVFIDELTDIFPDTMISHRQSSAIVHGTSILTRYLTQHSPQSRLDPLPSLKLKETTSHKIQIYSSSYDLPLSLPRNSFIPFIAQTTHTTNLDNKTYIRVYIYEGEKLTEENLTGIVTIEGLKKLPAGEVSLEVRFVIKTDGVVKVDMVKDLGGENNRSEGFTWDYEERGRVFNDDLEPLKEKFGNFQLEQPPIEESLDDLQSNMCGKKTKIPDLKIITHENDHIEPQTLENASLVTPTDSITFTKSLLTTPTTPLLPPSTVSTYQSPGIFTPTLRTAISSNETRTPTLRKPSIAGSTWNSPRTPRTPRTPKTPTPKTPRILHTPPSAALYSPLDDIDTPELLRAELSHMLASVIRLTNNKTFQSHIGAEEVSSIAIICDQLRKQIEDFGTTVEAVEENDDLNKQTQMNLLNEWRMDFEDLITPVLKRFDNVVFNSSPVISQRVVDESPFSFELPSDTGDLEQAKKKLSCSDRMKSLRASAMLSVYDGNSLVSKRSHVVSNGELDDIIEKFNKLVH